MAHDSWYDVCFSESGHLVPPEPFIFGFEDEPSWLLLSYIHGRFHWGCLQKYHGQLRWLVSVVEYVAPQQARAAPVLWAVHSLARCGELLDIGMCAGMVNLALRHFL